MSEMRIAVLGAGLVGNAIVRDLALDGEFEVDAVDRDPEALARLDGRQGVRCVPADLGRPDAVAAAVRDAGLVINAVPGFMGFATLRTVLESERNVVDIAFFPEDPFELDGLARERGVTAVVDCGVAPGLCNVTLGHLADRLDRIDAYRCYVGGLPVQRVWPFEYRACFSPSDVLEEYTRPARFVEGGVEIVRPALSEPELIDFDGIGTLEAFNTDGLRTLLRTMQIPEMKEKTLRYPGHADLMRAFRATGLLSTDPIEVNGQTIVPRELVSALLFEHWKLRENEEDLTVMRVEVDGLSGGTRVRHEFQLLDRYDVETGTTSMARTTGYTCAIVARQVARGLFRGPGINPPEFLGREEACWADLLAGLEARNIHWNGSADGS
jgi:saccharopine dehydrogenase-like NADP-dependent oxidoreductase